MGILTLTWAAFVMMMSLASACKSSAGGCSKPHIIYILADDVGWQDVGWNHPYNSYTPNLDRLRGAGVALTNYYAQPACSASRMALLTGKYPFTMGLQKNNMSQFHRWTNLSLPTTMKILPEYLRGQGYANHMVGKWQMGFCNWEYTPTRRGFDTFYGSYGGNSDHYTHIPDVGGYDFRNNLNVDSSAKGNYSTTLYTNRAKSIVQEHYDTGDTRPLFLYLAYEAPHVPIQAPNSYVKKFCGSINGTEQKTRCGMMAALDEGVGELETLLKDLGYLENSLIVFSSDNGAPGQGGGSNWPFRGKKRSAYEGGIKVPSFMYSKKLFPKQPYEYKGLMHITDWLPTLLQAAKADVDSVLPSNVDGIDQWSTIRRNEDSRRKRVVLDINEWDNYAAVRIDNWKLVRDNSKRCLGWFNIPAGKPTQKKSVSCKEYQLYDLEKDPYEKKDVSKRDSNNDILKELKKFLLLKSGEGNTLPIHANVTASFPENWDGNWSPGWCDVTS